MRVLRVIVLVLCLPALQSCAAVALSVAGMVGAMGIDHTLEGISYKTFTVPVPVMRLAVLDTLESMQMEVVDDQPEENGWKIDAKATDRKIAIEIEALTDRASRIRVVVDRGSFFFKDSATGTEIIAQTAESLGRLDQRRARIAITQSVLAQLGFNPGIADGRLGPKTRRAVRSFQRSRRIKADGLITAELLDALEQSRARREARRKKAEKRKPAPKSSSGS